MDSVGQMGVIWRNDYMAFILISAFGLCIYVLIFCWWLGEDAGGQTCTVSVQQRGSVPLCPSHSVSDKHTCLPMEAPYIHVIFTLLKWQLLF